MVVTKRKSPAPPPKAPRLDLRKIERGGLFAGVSAEDYHADPLPAVSVNQSTLWTLFDESPAHAWQSHPRLNPGWKPGGSTDEQDFGSAAHTCLTGAGKVDVVEASTWRTDMAKSRRQQARLNGATPVLKSTWSTVRTMVDTLRKNLGRAGSPIPDVFDRKFGGVPEVTAAWQEDGLWCRARADWWISPSVGVKQFPDGLIVDYKTTWQSAKAEAWASQLYRLGMYFQPVWYPHGFALAMAQSGAKVSGKLPRFVYIVQEAYPPFAHEIVEFSEVAVEHARGNLIEAFNRWHACIKTGDWPGYPQRVYQVDPPSWLVKADEFRRVSADVMQKPL